MIRNLGTAERIGRAGIGVILAVIGFNAGGVAMWILLGVGAVLIVTAAVSYCPIHHAIGISTVDNTISRVNVKT